MIECSLNSESTPLPPWLMLQLCELKLVWLCLELAATARCWAFVRKIVRRCFFIRQRFYESHKNFTFLVILQHLLQG